MPASWSADPAVAGCPAAVAGAAAMHPGPGLWPITDEAEVEADRAGRADAPRLTGDLARFCLREEWFRPATISDPLLNSDQ